MALALDLTRMIPSLPYKLDRIMDFGLYYGNHEGNNRERGACFSSPCSVCLHTGSEHLASCFGIYIYISKHGFKKNTDQLFFTFVQCMCAHVCDVTTVTVVS